MTFGSKIQPVSLKLDVPMEPDVALRINLFRRRSEELFANWQSLVSGGIRLGGGFGNNGNGSITGPGCGIETHRLKGLYVDYRFFHAKGELTNYFSVVNLLRRHSKNPSLSRCLARDRTHWKSAGILKEWHGWSADALIDVMFNGALFHADERCQPPLQSLHAAMRSELAQSMLTHCVYDRMLVVRRTQWMLEPLTPESPDTIRIPSEFATVAPP